jgi:hypothetical protein
MSRNATIVVVVGAIVAAVVAGWLALRYLGGMSEEGFKANFISSCQNTAQPAFTKAGLPPAEAQARAQAHCACAYSIIEPLPLQEKVDLEKGKDPARMEKFTADIKAKCVK